MLKTIQHKLILMFILIIIAIMTILGTFLYNNVSSFYHTEFTNAMTDVFSTGLVAQLESAAKSENPVDEMKIILDIYAPNIGIDSYRNYAVLDGKTGKYIIGTSDSKSAYRKTAVISEAMTGILSSQAAMSESIMEYAVPIPKTNPPSYIIYISDTKNEMTEMIENMLTIILQSLLLGLLFATVLGIFLARTISKPITKLTDHAEKLALGEFENFQIVKENDEIGILSNTFKYMSDALSESVNELAFEKNKLETVMRYMSDGIIAFDSNGSCLVINPAAKRLLDITDETEINFEEYFTKYFSDLHLGDYIYLDENKSEQRVININNISLKLDISSFKLQPESYKGVMVVIQDITKQEMIENSRREFVANVSHELKTPIATIKSYAETIMENELDHDTENSFLKVINKEADRMTRLITDLLTLSRLDSKLMLANREYFNVPELIGEILENLNMEAKKHNHNISYHEMNEIPPLFMDRDRLEQILINIISNALKYTPDNGKIDIFLRAMYGNIYIKVKDNGIGIPKKDLSRLFERFYRVDKARSREQGGTGLGLAISKEMLNAFGGEIYIDSEVDKGTEACIVLPLDGKRIIGSYDDKELFKEMKSI